MSKIYVSFILLISCLLFGSMPILAQQSNQSQQNQPSSQSNTKKDDKKKYPEASWWNGFVVQTDMISIASSAISYSDMYSFEAGVQFDLKHRYFPVIEFGYAGAEKIAKNNINFSTNGAFGRIGLDFNLTKQKVENPTKNLFLLGFRLGMTNASYKLSNITITDDYWGGSETLTPYSESPTRYWYEIVLGVKVLVAKNIFMGWSVRTKSLFGADDTSKMQPWYLPGYGKTGINWSFNYTIGYKIFSEKKNKSIKK